MFEKLKGAILAGAIMATGGAAHAITFNVAEDILPGGLGTLQAERATWAAATGAALSSEGFEGLGSNGSFFDFGDFSVSIASGSMTLFGANGLTRTEGTNGLGFTGSNVITFLFDNVQTAFGIDWSSFDQTETNVAYSDNGGGANGDIFQPVTTAGAGFFGVINENGFTEITFTVTQTEILEFDNIQYGAAAAIPVPASLPLLVGALGVLGFARRKRR